MTHPPAPPAPPAPPELQAPPAAQAGASWQGRVLPSNTEQALPGEYWEQRDVVDLARHRLWWRWLNVTTLVSTAASLPWIVFPRDPTWLATASYSEYPAGVVLGIAQALVLRPAFRHPILWAVATAVATLLGAAAEVALHGAPEALLGNPGPRGAARDAIAVIPAVLLVGLAQWAVLVRAGVAKAYRWVALTLAQGVVGAALAWLTFVTSSNDPEAEAQLTSSPGEGLAALLLFAAVIWLVTAPAASVLIRLLFPTPPPPPK